MNLEVTDANAQVILSELDVFSCSSEVLPGISTWLETWLGRLLNEKGDQIYRMKGVLALSVGEGMTEQLVYQGVHQQYSGELMGLLGPEEPRANRLVFIGKHLDEAQLKRDFMACRQLESTTGGAEHRLL